MLFFFAFFFFFTLLVKCLKMNNERSRQLSNFVLETFKLHCSTNPVPQLGSRTQWINRHIYLAFNSAADFISTKTYDCCSLCFSIMFQFMGNAQYKASLSDCEEVRAKFVISNIYAKLV